MSKKTPTQKYIDNAAEKAANKVADKAAGTTVQGCHFVGVEFDREAVSAIQTIAKGLEENAISLGKLAEVFAASNINVEAFLKIETPKQ